MAPEKVFCCATFPCQWFVQKLHRLIAKQTRSDFFSRVPADRDETKQNRRISPVFDHSRYPAVRSPWIFLLYKFHSYYFQKDKNKAIDATNIKIVIKIPKVFETQELVCSPII